MNEWPLKGGDRRHTAHCSISIRISRRRPLLWVSFAFDYSTSENNFLCIFFRWLGDKNSPTSQWLRDQILFRTAENIRKTMPTNAEDREKYKTGLLVAAKDMFSNDHVVVDAVETIIKQLKWCSALLVK